MKHIHKITLKKAQDDDMIPEDLSGLLDEVYAFVENMVGDKGKGGNGVS